MNRSIGLIAGAVLATGLIGCSLEPDQNTNEITRPGDSVTQAPVPHVKENPRCNPGTVCPR